VSRKSPDSDLSARGVDVHTRFRDGNLCDLEVVLIDDSLKRIVNNLGEVAHVMASVVGKDDPDIERYGANVRTAAGDLRSSDSLNPGFRFSILGMQY
jgi:hypothetical protein